MSAINIEVIDVTVEEVPRPSGKGSYEKATVTFKNTEGKVDAKTLLDFASKNVWPVITTAKKGDTFSVEREKDAKGYWVWTEIAKQDMPVAPTTNKTPTKPTYETPDERAQRQVYIIRQSSLTNAIALLGPKSKVEDVLKTASIFVDYVLQNGVEFLEDNPV
jgi:hypothetical protein